MPYPDNNPKTVHGLAKPGLFDVPPSALIELGRAMRLGKKKYGHFNWRNEKVSISTYYDAIQRHLLQFIDGEDTDNDPNGATMHLGNVMACCAILIDAFHTGMLIDDRTESDPNVASALIKEYTVSTTNPFLHAERRQGVPTHPPHASWPDLERLERIAKGENPDKA